MPPVPEKRSKRFSGLLGPALGLGLFIVALWVVHHELRRFHYRDILNHIRQIPTLHLALALLLTLINYAVMTGYDQLAIRFMRHSLRWGRTMLAAFVSYAFSNNVGLSILGASAVRYRMYASWGLSGLEIGTVVAFSTVTFHLGLCAVGGLLLILYPPTLVSSFPLKGALFLPLGVLFLACAAAYLLLCLLHRKKVRVRGFEFELPSPRMALVQLVLSSLDWVLAGAALYVLLPDQTTLDFPTFMGMFLLAQIVGMISQVPGGLGVFESLMLLLLSEHMDASVAGGALVLYRLIYYLTPLAIATVLMGTHEAVQRRTALAKAARVVGAWAPGFVPQMFAVMTFISGAILLFAGATPIASERVKWLHEALPLTAIELSHFLGSVVGMALLLLARGLRLRLDSAWALTVGLLLAGGVFSAGRGDYEEAVFLGVLLGALLPCRPQFYRKGALLARLFSPPWVAAVALVLACSIWLGFFSYKHLEFSNELWWEFSLAAGNAPRFLRATVGAITLALLVGLAALLRPAAPRAASPTEAEWRAVERVVSASRETSAHLALLGDKSFLVSASGNAFIMYASHGRSWVAMGDPVGPQGEWTELGWRFRELVDRHAGWLVFHNVGSANLGLYLDLGLTLVKVGEEARVSLPDFSLEGGERKGLRHTLHRMERENCVFEIAPAGQFEALEPELRRVSDAWLALKNTREKRFSLGCFKPEYLRRFPIALVRRGGEILAFANVWEGAEKEELSLDLMRHAPEAPAEVMEFLFTELMLWGQREGYAWFNMGMAPLSGFSRVPFAPMWHRMSAFVYQEGEKFYNFRGLRQYKEQFGPQWSPRYMASPGGLALPHIIVDLSALTSGGVKGIVSK